jgi:hypothetical protein
LILKRRFRETPKISFDLPYTVGELRCDYENIFQTILAKATILMADHLPVVEG